MYRWLPSSKRGILGGKLIPYLLQCELLTRDKHCKYISNIGVERSFPEPDVEAARKWHAQTGSQPLPGEIGEISYARSSGPGGQNVNKVNSKAQLRISLDQLLPMLPTVLHDGIRRSSYYTGRTNSLLIQSDESRKQVANKNSCYRKLNQLVIDVYNSTVPGETSQEQKEKVKKLQRVENEARLQMKKKHSSKKAARQKGRGDD